MFFFSELYLLQHLEAFISDKISSFINKISTVINIGELSHSILIARDLSQHLAATTDRKFLENVEETKNTEEDKFVLVQRLQVALTALHTQVVDNYENLKTVINPEILENISELIMHLQEDLDVIDMSFMPDMTQIISDSKFSQKRS